MLHGPRYCGLISALLLVIPAPAALAQSATEMRGMMEELGAKILKGKRLEQAIITAQAHPLGSKENPVRANGPRGERDYLNRLRCVGSEVPNFQREGSAGAGPYGTIMDIHLVRCPSEEAAQVFMDMYHDHIEARAIAGFDIAGDN